MQFPCTFCSNCGALHAGLAPRSHTIYHPRNLVATCTSFFETPLTSLRSSATVKKVLRKAHASCSRSELCLSGSADYTATTAQRVINANGRRKLVWPLVQAS